MSSRLALHLMGSPEIYLDHTLIPATRRKAVALLAYLAIEQGQHRRESLSALFWPDYDQSKAFTNLRHSLWEIQQSIGPGWLLSDRETIGWDPEANLWLDAREFEARLAQSHAQSNISLRIPLLVEAIKLYRNHFMTGFSLKDAPNFNEWSAAESEDLRCQFAGALASLTEDYCILGQAERAIPYARRLITLDPLNEAAHRGLMNVYLQAGQHSAALKQYQACEEILRKELNLDPQPETRELYKKIRKREIQPVPVLRPAEPASPRHNLPHQLSSFVGREKGQKEIAGLIAAHRLLTLTGAGGIGKTRLALQVAFALLQDFSGGIWFVELAPLSDATRLPQVILSALGLLEEANRSPVNMLTHFFRGKRALLILDNCEHLVHACAQLTETLLHTCSDLHILATSREVFSLAGEMLYRVPSLTTPDLMGGTVDTLSGYESVQLFVERAQLALPGFTLTQENTSAIAQVCHHLDGIPLALELAAARVNLLRVEEIAARLADRFHLLTGGTRTASPHHQTLRSMIDWSHDLLAKPERILLRRLSVFAGGWSLEAAESICADDDVEPHEILSWLTQLFNKSLIIVERKQGQETRYRMLETVRQYFREKLHEAGEGQLLRQRHLAYFVDLAKRAEPNLCASDMVRWLDRLETELDNLRAALEWAFESDIETELRLASALCRFWQLRDHKSEATEWLEQALAVEKTGRGDRPLTPDRAMIRGKALYVAGFLRLLFRETKKGTLLSEESLALFQELGTMGKQGMAYALWNLAEVADQQKDRRLAKTWMEQSQDLFREIGDKFGIAQCFPTIAYTTLIVTGDHERARALAEEGLALYQEIGDKNGLARILWTLGYLAYLQGDYSQASRRYESSLALFREVGNRYAWGVGTYYSGDAPRAQGQYERSALILKQALTFGRDSGMRNLVAEGHFSLGEVAAIQGDYQQATRQYEESLVIGQETGNPESKADGFFGLGRVAWALGDHETAIQNLETAVALNRTANNKFRTTRALYGLGRVAQSRGDYATARSIYTEAIMICLHVSDRCLAAFLLAALASLAVAQTQGDPAPRRFAVLRQASRLLGAAETLHVGIRFELLPAERAEYDRTVAAARAALGEQAFAAAYEEGKKMTLDEAVAYALEAIEGD